MYTQESPQQTVSPTTAEFPHTVEPAETQPIDISAILASQRG